MNSNVSSRKSASLHPPLTSEMNNYLLYSRSSSHDPIPNTMSWDRNSPILACIVKFGYQLLIGAVIFWQGIVSWWPQISAVKTRGFFDDFVRFIKKPRRTPYSSSPMWMLLRCHMRFLITPRLVVSSNLLFRAGSTYSLNTIMQQHSTTLAVCWHLFTGLHGRQVSGMGFQFGDLTSIPVCFG